MREDDRDPRHPRSFGKKGLTVQPFKIGPDFSDAGLHRLVADRPSKPRSVDVRTGLRYRLLYEARRGCRHSSDRGRDGNVRRRFQHSEPRAPAPDAGHPCGGRLRHGRERRAVVHGFLDFGLRIADCRLNASKSEIANRKSPIPLAGVIFNRVASEEPTFGGLKKACAMSRC